MGFFKTICYLLFTTTVIFQILNYAPNLLEFDPQTYTSHHLKFEGALAVNKDLDKGQIILNEEVHGPECLEHKDGIIYASLMDGKIVSFKDDRFLEVVADLSEGSKIPSRPLGLRFDEEDLYVADAKRGVLKVDVLTGESTVLVSKTKLIDGKYVSIADDLDVADGVIYFSDLSAKWDIKTVGYSILEHENSGRVYKHDISTGKTEVLLSGLYGPNGIQLTPDKKTLLIAEFHKSRILKFHLTGPQKGQTEVFALLPGSPDNIRLNTRGGYWVAMLGGRDSSNMLDKLASYPKIRKALARLSHVLATGLDWVNQHISSPAIASIVSELEMGFHFMMFYNTDHPVIIELGSDGEIIRSLHSANPKFSTLTHILEYKDHLYAGSFTNPFIVKVKL